MTDKIALAGTVGNDPIHTINSQGLVITKFRLVTHERRFDEKQQVWIDKQTNWYQVSTFRELAAHVAASVVKGQDVIVLGKLSLSDWNNGTKSGTNVAVEADAVGH
ncbi:MAG: single-stranded DNA-binding protein, partial [Burkholderiaceae bacterium]|nr:single-stranded DNA-binding protein [Microbacteriaceae bacterium]